jgi:hypothetical protein
MRMTTRVDRMVPAFSLVTGLSITPLTGLAQRAMETHLFLQIEVELLPP